MDIYIYIDPIIKQLVFALHRCILLPAAVASPHAAAAAPAADAAAAPKASAAATAAAAAGPVFAAVARGKHHAPEGRPSSRTAPTCRLKS